MSGTMDTAELTVPARVREDLDRIDRASAAHDAAGVQSLSYTAARELMLLFRRAGGSNYEVRAMANAIARETADSVPHLFDEVGDLDESGSLDIGGAA